MQIRPDILTASGAYFNFLEPDPATVTVEAVAHALSHICRFAGHTRRFYSVAQHCVLASYLVPEADARWALMHDAAEAFVGDVARPLKQLLGDYKAIEARAEAAVCAAFGLEGSMPPSVKDADLVLLATEQRDLMPAHDDQWALIEGVTPWEMTIWPWDHAFARRSFLERFYELWPEREPAVIEFELQGSAGA